MAHPQPDPRVTQHELGSFAMPGQSSIYVTHARPGCPRNAIIEVFDGYLRCWACRKPLTDNAARYVRRVAHLRGSTQEADGDVFIWNNKSRKNNGKKASR